MNGRGNGALIRSLKVQYRSLAKSKAGLEGTLANETEKYQARKKTLEGHIAATAARMKQAADEVTALGGEIE